ncbi:hypothetical protein GALL_449080 [mine drainage metagenome]|uniref:Uncharacterized protein n=1 Tax=mine drainage metagenome TaxID=410659 RepID=A0A1J5PPE5_9ZZZZ
MVEQANIRDQSRVDVSVADAMPGGAGIEGFQPGGKPRDPRLVGQIGLGEQQHVGHRSLFARFCMLLELRHSVHAVDRYHHGVQPVVFADDVGIHQVGEDGAGVGEAGGFDHQPAELGNRHQRAPKKEIAQGVGQFGAQHAAQAAGAQQHCVVGDVTVFHGADQEVIQPGCADLVDHHGGILHAGLAQQSVEQGRLAAAQKAREQGDRNAMGHVAESRENGSARAIRPRSCAGSRN